MNNTMPLTGEERRELRAEIEARIERSKRMRKLYYSGRCPCCEGDQFVVLPTLQGRAYRMREYNSQREDSGEAK